MFSLDFPVRHLKDSYQVMLEAGTFRLKSERRICPYNQSFAIAVSPCSKQEEIAILGANGNQSILNFLICRTRYASSVRVRLDGSR